MTDYTCEECAKNLALQYTFSSMQHVILKITGLKKKNVKSSAALHKSGSEYQSYISECISQAFMRGIFIIQHADILHNAPLLWQRLKKYTSEVAKYHYFTLIII